MFNSVKISNTKLNNPRMHCSNIVNGQHSQVARLLDNEMTSVAAVLA